MSKDYSYKKLNKTYRILSLGDSVLMGSGVNNDEMFSVFLEELLNFQSNEIKFDVINASTEVWGPLEYYTYLKNEGHKYDPDLVLMSNTYDDPIYNYNNKICFTGVYQKNNKVYLNGMTIDLGSDRLFNRFWGWLNNRSLFMFLVQNSYLLNYTRLKLSEFKFQLNHGSTSPAKTKCRLNKILQSSNIKLTSNTTWIADNLRFAINFNLHPLFTQDLIDNKVDNFENYANIILHNLIINKILKLVSDLNAKLLMIDLPSFGGTVGFHLTKPPFSNYFKPYTTEDYYFFN